MNNMREILFQGNRLGDGEWVYGDFRKTNGMSPCNAFIVTRNNEQYHAVHPESVGQFTGMHEFVAADESRNAMLFEGDIVEVWSVRRSCSGYKQSQYDKKVQVRAVIEFKHGKWQLNYNNGYNNALCKLRGNETDERVVGNAHELYYFYSTDFQKNWVRENGYTYHDIKRLGNKFANPELLEE